MCLSHVLSTFILVAFVVFIVLIVFQKLPHKIESLKSLIKAGILAFGISAIWILPFLRIQFSAQYSGMKGIILGYPLSQIINTSISSTVLAPNTWNKLYGIGILGNFIINIKSNHSISNEQTKQLSVTTQFPKTEDNTNPKS